MPCWIAVFERPDLQSEISNCGTEVSTFAQVLAELESSDERVG